MIVTRTPLRVSFVGGGSDLPSFCSREVGAVVSGAISESVYIIVNRKRGDSKIRVSYSKTELVDDFREIEHDLVRETLRMFHEADFGWDLRGLEIVSIADLPAQTGLGSSGAFTVGLINALAAEKKLLYSSKQFSDFASFVEMTRCKKPIGYQDQTASSFGGLKSYQFGPEGLISFEDLWSRELVGDLQRRLLLVDLGSRKPSSEALKKIDLNFEDSRDTATVRSLANLAWTFRDAFLSGKIDECGEILHGAWNLKAQLEGVSDESIDFFYKFARDNGAIGGKLCGAGGRGMFLLLARRNARIDLSVAIDRRFGYRTIGVQFEPYGSRVVYRD